MALGHGDRRKRSRRKEQLRPMAVTLAEHGALRCGFISRWLGCRGGYQDQLIPWDELWPGLLAPVPPVTSVPQPCGHLLWLCHGDTGTNQAYPVLGDCPSEQGMELVPGSMPSWTKLSRGKGEGWCVPTSPESVGTAVTFGHATP